MPVEPWAATPGSFEVVGGGRVHRRPAPRRGPPWAAWGGAPTSWRSSSSVRASRRSCAPMPPSSPRPGAPLSWPGCGEARFSAGRRADVADAATRSQRTRRARRRDIRFVKGGAGRPPDLQGRGRARPAAPRARIVGQLPRVRGRTPGLPRGGDEQRSLPSTRHTPPGSG